MIKKLFLIIAVAAVLLPAPAAPAQDSSRSLLLIVPQSGPLKNLGEQALRGAELALKVWGGGLNLEVRNETGDTERAIDLTRIAAVVGYFTESRFQLDAPRYLYFRTPVFLPFLTNPDAAIRGPASFFRLMPSAGEQGEYMALQILSLKKRPRRILVIKGADDQLGALADAFVKTLNQPPAPEEPPPAAKGRKAARPAPPLRPLDPKTPVIMAEVNEILAGEEIEELNKNTPDLIVMAMGLPDALRLAPVLADSKWKKTTLWGGAYLGFREAGAAYASLGLNLHLCLPVVNLADPQNKTLQEFKHKYVDAYQAHPTWISALAYDSMTLVIKGVSRPDPRQETLLEYLSGQGHQSLTTYELAPGAGVAPPMAFMPVRVETVGFLP